MPSVLSPQVVSSINALGGRQLPIGQSVYATRVTLENFAATDTQRWQVNALTQLVFQHTKGRL